ncbi:uncharacterized protein F5891DRAFT_1221105 [Suillus fuscotomentosus]|uniref:Uncharacterized protein n=1 Tax=Suillus fuscotomentosus TaxID=1912939 RepID=A0AAD4EAX7_9AGAM|nr:uncharacterized protein F5891DRAFT_1221105 [Suillus fuscotomentosus]KAG1901654.1 hypothetical protein F5891DRAFT_1221105 [Suillus fuscotomentosus]
MSMDLYFWSLAPILMLTLTLLFVLALLHPFMLALSYLFSRANSLPLVLSFRASSLMPSYFSMSLAPATSPASLRTVHQPVLKKVRGFALNAGDFGAFCLPLDSTCFALIETFIIALRPTHFSSLHLVHRPGLEKIRGFAANAGGFGAFYLPLGLYSSSLGTLSAIQFDY